MPKWGRSWLVGRMRARHREEREERVMNKRRLSRVLVFGGAAILISSAFLPWPWRLGTLVLGVVAEYGGLLLHPYFECKP